MLNLYASQSMWTKLQIPIYKPHLPEAFRGALRSIGSNEGLILIKNQFIYCWNFIQTKKSLIISILLSRARVKLINTHFLKRKYICAAKWFESEIFIMCNFFLTIFVMMMIFPITSISTWQNYLKNDDELKCNDLINQYRFCWLSDSIYLYICLCGIGLYFAHICLPLYIFKIENWSIDRMLNIIPSLKRIYS